MKNQRDYYEDWLVKLRKELAISGRKSELCLYFEINTHISRQESRDLVQRIIDGEQRADLDTVLEVDQWRARGKSTTTPDSQIEFNLAE